MKKHIYILEFEGLPASLGLEYLLFYNFCKKKTKKYYIYTGLRDVLDFFFIAISPLRSKWGFFIPKNPPIFYDS